MNLFFKKIKSKLLLLIQNKKAIFKVFQGKNCLAFLKWLVLTPTSLRPFPETAQEHQTLKVPGSEVAWRLPAQIDYSEKSFIP